MTSRWAADEKQAQQAWDALRDLPAALPRRYEPDRVAALPAPARRFFDFMIAPGTLLTHVVEIRMEGELSLGTKDKPAYRPMRAEQILSAPHGLVWKVAAGHGLLRFEGSDGMVADRSWTRFWLWRLLPLVRAGGDADHLRSAFGRVVAEAALWAPGFLLARSGVAWTAIDADTARATVTHGGMTQDVDLRVDAEGRPLWVCIPRWSNANPDRVFRVQPFGGVPSDFREVGGYRLPFRLEGGNFFGTGDYFPFYRARVLAFALAGARVGPLAC